MIKLLDNRTIDRNAIELNAANQRFYIAATGEDVSRLIRIADKRTFAGFDANKYADLVYQESHPGQGGPLPTNTTRIFAEQIITDPLAAPADAAAAAVDTVKKTFTSPVTLIIVGVLVAGLVVYYLPRARTA